MCSSQVKNVEANFRDFYNLILEHENEIWNEWLEILLKGRPLSKRNVFRSHAIIHCAENVTSGQNVKAKIFSSNPVLPNEGKGTQSFVGINDIYSSMEIFSLQNQREMIKLFRKIDSLKKIWTFRC